MSDNKGFMAQPGLPSSFASPGDQAKQRVWCLGCNWAFPLPREYWGAPVEEPVPGYCAACSTSHKAQLEGSWSEIMGALNSLRQKQLASATPVTQGRCAKCHGLFPIATFVGPDRLLEVNCEECRKANNDKEEALLVSMRQWGMEDQSKL